ncbi:hypothetical protein Plhal304r1_c067g0155471 [Plasmopara halstedii]
MPPQASTLWWETHCSGPLILVRLHFAAKLTTFSMRSSFMQRVNNAFGRFGPLAECEHFLVYAGFLKPYRDFALAR